MAHVAKYQSGALGNMCAHYARTPEIEHGYVRVNIDPERMHLNYNLAPSRPGGDVAFINDRIASLELKRAPRKDAVKMCDCVLTKPKALDDSRTREFFQEGYEFLCARYGRENVISAWVHMDEATPHMHFAWVPVTHDGRLSAKDVVSRHDLQTLHQEMQDWFDDTDLKVSVLLDDDQIAEKQLSHLKQDEYIAAKQKLEKLDTETKQANERLERLRCAETDRMREVDQLNQEVKRVNRAIEQAEELQPAAETVSESLRTLSEARGDGKREEGLREAIRGLRERIRNAQAGIERLRERVKGLREEKGLLRGTIERLRMARVLCRDRFAEATVEFARILANHPHIDASQLIQMFSRDGFRGRATLDVARHVFCGGDPEQLSLRIAKYSDRFIFRKRTEQTMSSPSPSVYEHQHQPKRESPSLERDAMRATQAARALNADYQSRSRSRGLSI